jgi:F-type H+-transporting ATPase subunit b
MATEATDAAAAAGHAAAGAGSHGGMPQLDFTTYPNQIFWLVIALLAIWWMLSRLALPRIGAVLAERAGTITNDIAAAEELSLKIRDAEAAYDKALVEARAEAAKIVATTRAEIKAELDAATARADAEIAAKTAESEAAIAEIRASAAQSVRQVALAAAAEIVAAMGGSADAAAVAAAVDARTKG